MSDTRSLVLGAQNGNSAALEQLLRIWYPRLRRAAGNILRSDYGAEDVVQETCLKLSQKVGTLADPGAFAKWAHQILRRCCVDFLRREKADRFVHVDFADPSVEIDSMNLYVQPTDELIDAERLLNRIEGNSLRVVGLRVLLGLNVRETAGVLGISQGTVKSRLHTARKQLRQLCEA